MEKLKLVWSVKSECGPVRKKNEDSVFPDVSGSIGFGSPGPAYAPFDISFVNTSPFYNNLYC